MVSAGTVQTGQPRPDPTENPLVGDLDTALSSDQLVTSLRRIITDGGTLSFEDGAAKLSAHPKVCAYIWEAFERNSLRFRSGPDDTPAWYIDAVMRMPSVETEPTLPVDPSKQINISFNAALKMEREGDFESAEKSLANSLQLCKELDLEIPMEQCMMAARMRYRHGVCTMRTALQASCLDLDTLNQTFQAMADGLTLGRLWPEVAQELVVLAQETGDPTLPLKIYTAAAIYGMTNEDNHETARVWLNEWAARARP